jgi:acyl dehydratase
VVVRGTYTKEEERMLAECRESWAKLVGWLGETPSEQVPYPVFHRVATKDLITHMAYAADYWNPLWRDENYARNTRWGGIIAPPFFQQCIAHGGPNFPLKVPPEVGIARMEMGGDYWEFFKPIRVGDSFKVWVGLPNIQDVTRPGKDSPRRLRIMGNVSYINQRDEVTGIMHRVSFTSILPPGTEIKKNEVEFTREYIYTKEEIAAIDREADAEEIRGANPRYWEDVSIGDELKPVVLGPVTVWDQVLEMQGFGIACLPMREVRRQTPERVFIDAATNIPHKSIEFHLSEGSAKALGHYSTTLIAVTVEHFLGRLITNWMGDDGFLRRFDYLKLANTPHGDTFFGRGRVIKKHVSADGEHLVDLDVWMESVRGYIPNVATATVSLLSREKVFV